MIRVLTIVLLAVAAVLGGVLYARTATPALGGTSVDSMPAVPDVMMVAHDGRERRLSDWAGRTRVVFFGFTRCPDVCPATLGVLARAYEALPADLQDGLQVVVVTVDPEYDTPDVMGKYVAKFNADFVGLTGEQAAVDTMKKGFYVSSHHDGHGMIAHNDQVLIVDGEGRMRRVYNGQTVMDGTLTKDLAALARGRL